MRDAYQHKQLSSFKVALERYTDLESKNDRHGDEWEDSVESRIECRLREAGVDDELEVWGTARGFQRHRADATSKAIARERQSG